MNVTDASALPDHVRCVDPSPDELPDNGRPPLPALITLQVQFCFGTFYVVVPQSPAGVELLRTKEYEQCDCDLEDHANTDEEKRAIDSVSPFHSRDNSLEAVVAHGCSFLLADWYLVTQRTHVSDLLLSACNVEKLSVGSLEQSHTEGHENAHHPKDNRAGEVCAKRVRENADSSIYMKGDYSSEENREFPHSNGGKLTMPTSSTSQ